MYIVIAKRLTGELIAVSGPLKRPEAVKLIKEYKGAGLQHEFSIAKIAPQLLKDNV